MWEISSKTFHPSQNSKPQMFKYLVQSLVLHIHYNSRLFIIPHNMEMLVNSFYTSKKVCVCYRDLSILDKTTLCIHG